MIIIIIIAIIISIMFIIIIVSAVIYDWAPTANLACGHAQKSKLILALPWGAAASQTARRILEGLPPPDLLGSGRPPDPRESSGKKSV
jgi:hypothetical protein